MAETIINILKSNSNRSIPEIFCQNIEYYIANYNHIKIITQQFSSFIDEISHYLLLYKDYQLFSDIYFIVIIYNNNRLIISSIDIKLAEPIDLVVFDRVLPSKYPYGELTMLSIIKTYDKQGYDFYYNIIKSKADFKVVDNIENTVFMYDGTIYFMDGIVNLYKLGDIDITPIISNTNQVPISLPSKIYLNLKSID